MPDQPDDAPKRHQRGVFPPFFAPRNGGRPDGSPTPLSGSWRRVSRLFTPPEGTRQRRTPAVQQTPYTPPLTPVEPEVPVESLAPEVEVEEQSTAATNEALDVMAQSGDPTDTPVAAADSIELERAVSDEMVIALGGEVQGDDILDVREELRIPFAASPETGEGDASLDAVGGLSLAPDMDDFMVESLEPKPISLDPSDATGMDVTVESVDGVVPRSAAEAAAEPFDSDVTYDEMFAAASHEAGESVQPAPTHEELESVERYLVDEPALANDHVEIAAPDRESIVEYQREEPLAEEGGWAAAAQDAEAITARDPLGDEAVEMDPWVGTELPEPAFGSIGWPPVDAAPPASDPAADGVDEMSAALAWSDAEDGASTGAHRDRASHDEATEAGDDVLSAMVGELRDSSSAWKSDSDSIVDERADVAARAHFYAAPEPIDPADELAAALEQDAYAMNLPEAERGASIEADAEARAEHAAEATMHAADAEADEHAGAAIADALARVAARIRSGEVELPSEAAGTSDESALAAALAALLRGPRR
jgi:hypothetical protein